MILVYGTVCLDRLHQVPGLPKPGGYVEIQKTERQLGGEALNTAAALNNWQADFKLAGNPLDQSEDARWMLQALQSLAFPNLEIPTNGDLLPVCDLYITPDGERTMFGYGFAQLPEICNPAQVDLTNVTLMTVDGNLGPAAAKIARLCKTKNIPAYVMDVDNGLNPSPNDVWQNSTDRLGQRGDIQENLRVVKEKIKTYQCLCILSDGANGFVAGSPTRPIRHYPPFPAPKVVDTTGAGDAFRAGMVYGLSQNWPLSDCFRFASATGCLNCRAVGAIAGLPTRQEVEDLIKAHPETARAYD